MKKFTLTPKAAEIERKWYIVDAKDKVMGRIAAKIADKLRGKGKPIYASNVDCGDFVIVINAEKIKLTGGKMDKKIYFTHTGYPGGLKQETAKHLLARIPTKALELAVKGMLPRNRLRNDCMKKLKLFAGETHPHEAQQPIKLEL